jgi:tetratricopeptide (TPR) repeat protein
VRRFQPLILLILASCLGARAGFAADAKPPATQRLLDRTPFDQVILNKSNGGKILEVLPLNLPDHAPNAAPKEANLKVRLLDRPTEEFEVAWANVAQVRVFDEVLLDEAQRLTAAGKFDEAYDYFAKLGAQYPSTPNLNEAVCTYLRLNALALYRDKQYDRALALLITLYQRNSSDPGLPNAVESVAGEIIQQYLHNGDYTAARRVLALWENQFQNIAPQAVAAWQARFQAAANRQVEDANALIAQKQYIPARKAVGRALAIWPNLPAATQAFARIAHDFPAVTVGVFEPSPKTPARRIDDWASIRALALTQPLLAEEVDFGAEGGIYRSPFGEWNLDESGRELTLKLNPKPAGSGATGISEATSRYLLSLATPGSPGFNSNIASLLEGISIAADGSLTLHLKRVHVRPESQLQLPAPTTTASARYSIADFGPKQVIFAAANTSGPRAVIEQTQASDDEAVAALRNGDIDVLDRVPPWHVERLRAENDIRVAQYKLPTVHVLIPNLKRPLLAKREFRRALCYGIDRKWIVDRVLLGGNPLPGFDVLSGPFPTGVSLSDPIRYAYNSQVQPRPFEPRLAAILATVAWASVQNPEKNKDHKEGDQPKDDAQEKSAVPNLPELSLVLPIDPIARVACQSIQAQLAREGVTVKLHELTTDELLSDKTDYDLRYAELAVWEPVADARRIFALSGSSPDAASPYVESALRNLDAASNWKDVRARLAELHQIADHELPLIPLWQTVNYFAYRTSLRGVGEAPITLYQNIDQWDASAPANVARTATVQSP